MKSNICLAIAIVLTILGLLIFLKSRKDAKETADLKTDDPARAALKSRDMQYRGVGLVCLLSGGLLLAMHFHKSS